jgi:hypothetical protein
MQLPEQITPERLIDTIETYSDRLDHLPPLPPVKGPKLIEIRGGRVREQVRGWTVIDADSSLRLESGLNTHYPIVEVKKGWDRMDVRSTYHFESTASQLIGVQGEPRDTGHLTDPTRRHRFVLDELTRTVTVRLVCFTDPVIIGPFLEGTGPLLETYRYEIPAAATHIYGSGIVEYVNGTRRPIRPDLPEPLLRPTLSGDLGIREGGVYAEFIGQRQAHVRIGNAWIPTPKIE